MQFQGNKKLRSVKAAYIKHVGKNKKIYKTNPTATVRLLEILR